MRIDLYTDAGVKNGVATWAVVALVPGLGEPVEASGRLRADTNCSATAECRAIANALHRLIRLGYLERGASVRVISDSRHAVDRIAGRIVKRPASSMALAVAVILAIGKKHALTITSLWVPGHKPDRFSDHARWNNRCDALCRAARAKATGGHDRPSAPPEAAPVARTISKPRRAVEIARRLEGRS